MCFVEKSSGLVFEKLTELVDDLCGGERTDAEVGQPDVFAALCEAHVEFSFIFLHKRIERVDDPCALHVVAAGDFALVDFHDGEMPTVFWRMDHVEIALPFDEIVAGLRLMDPDGLVPRLLRQIIIGKESRVVAGILAAEIVGAVAFHIDGILPL